MANGDGRNMLLIALICAVAVTSPLSASAQTVTATAVQTGVRTVTITWTPERFGTMYVGNYWQGGSWYQYYGNPYFGEQRSGISSKLEVSGLSQGPYSCSFYASRDPQPSRWGSPIWTVDFSIGSWSPTTTLPSTSPPCASTTEGNANWASTSAGTQASGACLSGYTGTPTRSCNAGGVWGSISGSCTSLPCASTTEGNANWATTSAGTQASGSCLSGYTGSPTRSCTTGGVWGSIVSSCESRSLPGRTPVLVAAGQFSKAGGATANRVAQWNGTAWFPIGDGEGPGGNGNVEGLALYNGRLVVGMNSGFRNTAEYNGTQWLTLGSDTGGLVTTFVEYNGRLVAGGGFRSAGGMSADFIAQWNGTAWSSLAAGTWWWVLSMTVYKGNLLAGGDIYYVGQWNGAVWSEFSRPDYPSVVRAFAQSNDQLYVGGSFNSMNGVAAKMIARWSGSAWFALGSGLDSIVWALAIYDGNVVAGGWLTMAGGVPASRIAQWNGVSWSALGAGVNGASVNALVIFDGTLLVGGSFSSAGGMPADNIALWNGAVWSSLGSGVNGGVGALMVYNSLFCPASTGENATWPHALANTIVLGACITGYTGAPKRACSANGVWATATGVPCTFITATTPPTTVPPTAVPPTTVPPTTPPPTTEPPTTVPPTAAPPTTVPPTTESPTSPPQPSGPTAGPTSGPQSTTGPMLTAAPSASPTPTTTTGPQEQSQWLIPLMIAVAALACVSIITSILACGYARRKAAKTSALYDEVTLVTFTADCDAMTLTSISGDENPRTYDVEDGSV